MAWSFGSRRACARSFPNSRAPADNGERITETVFR